MERAPHSPYGQSVRSLLDIDDRQEPVAAEYRCPVGTGRTRTRAAHDAQGRRPRDTLPGNPCLALRLGPADWPLPSGRRRRGARYRLRSAIPSRASSARSSPPRAPTKHRPALDGAFPIGHGRSSLLSVTGWLTHGTTPDLGRSMGAEKARAAGGDPGRSYRAPGPGLRSDAWSGRAGVRDPAGAPYLPIGSHSCADAAGSEVAAPAPYPAIGRAVVPGLVGT